MKYHQPAEPSTRRTDAAATLHFQGKDRAKDGGRGIAEDGDNGCAEAGARMARRSSTFSRAASTLKLLVLSTFPLSRQIFSRASYSRRCCRSASSQCCRAASSAGLASESRGFSPRLIYSVSSMMFWLYSKYAETLVTPTRL